MASYEIFTKKRWRILSRATSICVLIVASVAQVPAADQQATAVTAFRNFLSSTKLDAHWQDGDLLQIDSAELRAAYDGRLFYFTFREAPLRPGAAFPAAIARYDAALAEYEKHSLRLTVGIDQAMKVTPFQLPNDFNAGLMPVKSEADAKMAAAAILSLIGNDQVHPEAIAASEVSVTASKSGWTCNAKRTRAFDGTVVFDASGKCVSAKKVLNYMPLTPP
jgi:hypothetical protein